jgi:hypothetical protein
VDARIYRHSKERGRQPDPLYARWRTSVYCGQLVQRLAGGREVELLEAYAVDQASRTP